MPTVNAQNGFSKIEFRENTIQLNNPTISQVVDAIENSLEDVMITGQAPVLSKPMIPKLSTVRTIASMDTRLLTEIATNNHGWMISPGFNIKKLHMIGIGGIQNRPGKDIGGINIRLSGSAGRGIADLLIEDCYLRGFDTDISIVDDWQRITGNPGRIKANVRRNNLLDSVGNDSHSINLYLEGMIDGTLVEENIMHKAGWVEDRDKLALSGTGEPEANKREHNVYAQSINGKIDLYNNFFGEPSANAYQLRAGGDAVGNVLWRAPVGGWHSNRPEQKVIQNIQIDQVDINSVLAIDGRGHGLFASEAPNCIFMENIVARKRGRLKTKPGLEVGGGTAIRNHVYDWGTGDYITGAISSRSYGNVTKTAPGSADYLLSITDSMVQRWRDRKRGEWDNNSNHIAYRNKVQYQVFGAMD